MSLDRVSINTSFSQAVFALSEGNPGAITVLIDLAKQGPRIDPDAIMAEWGGILDLDHLRIYGSDIWLLYKDICGQSYVRTLGVLRAVQLGILHGDVVKNAVTFAKSPWDKVNPLPPELISTLLEKVRERLPKFGEELA